MTNMSEIHFQSFTKKWFVQNIYYQITKNQIILSLFFFKANIRHI